MKAVLAMMVLAGAALAGFGSGRAAEPASGAAAIRSLLATQKNWTLYSEYTEAELPSDRAQKLQFDYYERGEKLMGRWRLEFGGCEFEVTVQPDGFRFPWCPPYHGEPALSFDPGDMEYPFRSRPFPRKLWLKAGH